MLCLGVSLVPLALALSVLAQSSAIAPQVKLSIGTFQGSVFNGTDRFLGVPFAQPPVGSLRFKAPTKITTPFSGVRDAVEFGNSCPQPGDESSLGAPIGEDCLVLNVRPFPSCVRTSFDLFKVWRPENASAGDKLPVIVWFYVRKSAVYRLRA
jgi:carboxylesterase type B